MTKAEVLAKLEKFAARADRLTVEKREVISSALYEGAVQGHRADCYRIAIALIRQIDEGATNAE